MHDNIISLFGEKLSELIQKPPMASKGLIRFAIRDYRKAHNIEYDCSLSMGEFEQIVDIKVRDLIIRAKFKNSDKLIDALLSEITFQQAIFTMSS